MLFKVKYFKDEYTYVFDEPYYGMIPRDLHKAISFANRALPPGIRPVEGMNITRESYFYLSMLLGWIATDERLDEFCIDITEEVLCDYVAELIALYWKTTVSRAKVACTISL